MATKSKKKKKNKSMKIFINILVLLILIPAFLTAGIFSIGYMYKLELYKTENLQVKMQGLKEKNNYTATTDISKCFLEGVVSIEDHRFYEHNGFDIISFSRAMLVNIKTANFSQGGSTITQQLAKNLYLDASKNFFRKATELLIAIDIEKNYSKEQILESYVNIIYYGKNSYGISNASKTFFNKNPINLTHVEAAYLAGLTQSPTLYSSDDMLGNKRKDLVLDAMSRYSNCNHNRP
ncbi:MAG: biosynthetic peptidoglycan transglycosylase [Clostridia bacterium]